MTSQHESASWRAIFGVAALVSLALMIWVSFDYGVSGDELLQDEYGELVFRYFRSMLVDRSAIHFGTVYKYGGLFELMAAVAERFSPLFHYDTRHVLNCVVGWVGMIYAARCADLMRGPRAAVFALFMMMASPYYFGHCMNNSKDIPFATGYVASIYYLLQIRLEDPLSSPTLLAKIGAAIAFAIGVRVGGLVLICYLWMTLGLCVFITRQWDFGRVMRIVGSASLVSLAALLAGTVFCPWAIQKPLTRPFEALATFSHLAECASIPVLFEGRYLPAAQLPIYYAPKMLAITLPVTVLVVGLSSFVLMGAAVGQERLRLGILWVSCAFPVLHVMYIHAILYSGIRQLLFVTPPLTVLAAVGCDSIVEWAAEGHYLRWCAPIVLAVGMIDPIRFSLVNHPHQIVYFNPLVGGLRGAFLRYEVDTWGQASPKEAVRWILREGGGNGGSIRITGGRWPFRVMIRPCVEQYGRLIYAGKGDPPNANFRIQLLQFEPWRQLEALRSGNILHVISADGVPLCLVKAGRGWRADND